MGNRNSSARPSTISTLFTSCCKCRTYSLDGPDNGVGHNGAAAPPAPNAVEMNERQPVAPGSDQPVDNQPSTENPHASPADSDKPEMFTRLPRPPRNPVGKSSSSFSWWTWQRSRAFVWLCITFCRDFVGSSHCLSDNNKAIKIVSPFLRLYISVSFRYSPDRIIYIYFEFILTRTRQISVFSKPEYLIKLNSIPTCVLSLDQNLYGFLGC